MRQRPELSLGISTKYRINEPAPKHTVGIIYLTIFRYGGLMAVLVEGISVIVRRDAIDRCVTGGWDAFVTSVPNGTLCADDEIARVGFLSPQEVENFIKSLTASGLSFVQDNRTIDIAVADQQRGLTTQCDWLEFGRLPFGDKGRTVAVCWFFSGKRVAAGLHLAGSSMQFATPSSWNYENSLSEKFEFIPLAKQK